MAKHINEQTKLKIVNEYYSGMPASIVYRKYSIPKSTFFSWVKKYRKLKASRDSVVTLEDYRRLERKYNKLNREIEVLKRVNCKVSDPLQIKLSALEELYELYSVRTLCSALDVSRGTFYNHILRNKKENNSYVKRREDLRTVVWDIFESNNQIFGAEKIRAVMVNRGYRISPNMVRTLMKEMGIESIRTHSKKDYKRLSDFENKKNILDNDFTAQKPNEKWVSDITCHKIFGCFYYICAIMDLYSRKIVSYKVSQNNSTQLITSAFKEAFIKRQPNNGLLFHSDRGTQYTSFAFRKLLKECKAIQSFSNSANPYNNSVMEFFFLL